MGTDLTISKVDSPQLWNDLSSLMTLSKIFAVSGLVPKEYVNKPEACAVAIMLGRDLGLAPLAAMRWISVVNGRPSIWGDGMLALVIGHPTYRGHKLSTWDEMKKAQEAVFTVRRALPDGTITTYEGRFSVEDAQVAKLWTKEGPWRNYPWRMLGWRATGFGCRDGFADVLSGLDLREEAQDIEPETVQVQSRVVTEESRPVRRVASMALNPIREVEDIEPGPEMAETIRGMVDQGGREPLVDTERDLEEQEEPKPVLGPELAGLNPAPLEMTHLLAWTFSKGPGKGSSIWGAPARALVELADSEVVGRGMDLLRAAARDELERRVADNVPDPVRPPSHKDKIAELTAKALKASE